VHIPETDAVFGYACAVFRPQWNGERVTELQEALILASTPVSIAITCLAVITLWQRKLWLGLILCLCWAAWAFHIFAIELLYDPHFTAQTIGCIGYTLTYLILGSAICFTIAAFAFIQKLRTNTP